MTDHHVVGILNFLDWFELKMLFSFKCELNNRYFRVLHYLNLHLFASYFGFVLINDIDITTVSVSYISLKIKVVKDGCYYLLLSPRWNEFHSFSMSELTVFSKALRSCIYICNGSSHLYWTLAKGTMS